MAQTADGRTAWIGWCDNHPPDQTVQRTRSVFAITGAQRRLVLTDGVPVDGCQGRLVPVGPDQVVWFGPLPRGATRLDAGVAVQGMIGPRGFLVSDVWPLGQSDDPMPPHDQPPSPVTGRHTDIAAWIWQPQAWHQPAKILDTLARLGARVVYVTVPVDHDGVGQAQMLGDFIAVAGGQGIAVWAVIGDPRAVLPDQRPLFEDRARLYADYNVQSAPNRRLSGLQLDIEPYLLPGYDQDARGWDDAYVTTVNAVARAAQPLPVELAMPAWFGQPIRQQRILDRLAPQIVGVTVMDYRTDPQQIIDGAMPFLVWASKQGKGVRIALEFGALPDEDIRLFAPTADQTGPLWRLPVDGGDVMILLDHDAHNPLGDGLAQVGLSLAPGNAQTFHHRPDAGIEMVRVMGQTFKPWPSFLGMAIHGMD